MRISITVFVILISTYIVNASVLDPVIENVVHLKASKPPNNVPGIWKKKTIWKPRWVKEWKSAKVMKPVWRKVWGPIQIREWLPIPKPPPGWDTISTLLKPQNSPLKDSLGHHSFIPQSTAKIPLWDPVPYPQSQQPPPPPPSVPQLLHSADASCSKGECDSSPSQTFNHQQISEIISPRYQTPEYQQNLEYSETVNHLTRIPPDNWRPPQSFPDSQFNNFAVLPEFLIPPKFQSPLTLQNKPNPSIPPIQVTPSPGFEVPNEFRQWTPLPPANKGHFITKAPDQPYNFQLPQMKLPGLNDTNVPKEVLHSLDINLKEKPRLKTQNKGINGPTHANSDFIQEAELVGEYHYSEFDLPSFKLEQNQTSDKKEQPKTKPKQNVKTNQESANKPKINEEPVVKNNHRQTELHSQKNPQKKHISNLSLNHNLQRQEAKEIFPIYRRPEIRNLTSENPISPQNTSTKLLPAATNPKSNTSRNQQQEELLSQNVNPIILPPNHRFSPLPEFKPLLLDLNTTEALLNNSKPEKHLYDHRNSVQLVFAKTPEDYNRSMENSQKTTTEPYEILFLSSSLSTTESVTRTPVVIVTPDNSGES